MDYEVLNTFLAVVAFILGGMIGSFLNVCVYRIPKGESVIHPRSKCPNCGNMIVWYDNIPMVSWLILNARCRQCRTPISWQYPLVEAITATLFLLVYLRFGLVAATPVYLLLVASLVLVTFVDLTDWTIPDEVTLPGIPIGIACSVVAMIFPNSGFRLEYMYNDVFDSVIGVVVGGGSLYLLDKLTLLILKKRGMGFGDVKLLAMLGAFLGWKGVILIIVVASFIGSFIGIAVVGIQHARGKGEKDHYLPFGPYLALGGVVVLFFGSDIIELYNAFILGQGGL
ncbi:MAG: prepilin peptidase [bacterium]|nr:prepilin peptidase [bacterium]